jgi:hypothetical protein
LVTSADKLEVGDEIDDVRVMAFFKKDSAKASAAARTQAAKAGITDDNFIVVLGSVNFQLGTKWTHTFAKTWSLIVAGQYKAASVEVQKSRWYSQTPVRVKDLQHALLALEEKKKVAVKK